MSKEIAFTVRPEKTGTADKWVAERKVQSKPAGKTKRLTIDVPEDLHRELKIFCVKSDVDIASHVRGLIAESLASV